MPPQPMRLTLDSPLWWPARAAIGDGEVLSLLLAGGLVLLGAVMAIFSPRFADTAVSVAATARSGPSRAARDRISRRFAATGAARARNSCCCGATRGCCRRA